MFSKRPVAQLTFKAIQLGSTTLEFKFEKGQTNDSNLVMVTTDEILTEVENFIVNVAESKSLSTGGSFIYKTDTGSTITFTVDDIRIPENQCADCFIEADITAVMGEKTESFTFVNGGIAGKIVDTKTVHGHSVQVGDITADSLLLSILSEEEL